MPAWSGGRGPRSRPGGCAQAVTVELPEDLPRVMADAPRIGAATFEALQRRVWGPGKGDPQAVRSAVTKLRRKLGEDARNPRYILAKRGLGYRTPGPDDP